MYAWRLKYCRKQMQSGTFITPKEIAESYKKELLYRSVLYIVVDAAIEF
jgi:hypothetical protein